MSFYTKPFVRKTAWTMALVLTVATGFAGERIEFSKEKVKENQEKASTEPQESARGLSFTSKLFKAYRPSDTVSGSDLFKSKSVLPAPRVTAPPPSNKRNEELLDRQKNWIFLTPADAKKTNEGNEAFNLGNENPLLNRKGLLTRFLENKVEKDPKLVEKNMEQPGIVKLPDDATAKSQEISSAETPRTGSLQPQFFDRTFTGSEAEKARFDLWRDQFGPEANRLKEEKQARMKEFEGLFSSQSNPSLNGGTSSLYDPLTAPVQNGRRPEGTRFNSTAVSSSIDPYRLTTRPVASGGIQAAPDINSRVFGPSPSPASSLEPVKPFSQPAVLPFPKRHF